MMNLPKIEDLFSDAIDSKPFEFDFSQGYGETWDIVRPDVDEFTLADCIDFLDDNRCSYEKDERDYLNALCCTYSSNSSPQRVAMDFDTVEEALAELDGKGIDHTDDDSEFVESLRSKVRQTMEENDYDFPVMNYIYPLPSGYSPDSTKLNNIISTTMVHILETGTYGLALTGGGMDFSLEICKSFIALGYLPPVHFCDLPRNSRFPHGSFDRLVVEACKESCRIAISRIGFTIERLNSL